MALNYVDEKFAQIECDKVCADFYEVRNLLKPKSSNDNKWNQEATFMVESFVTPPVSVRVQILHHPIDIHAIDIGLQVRTHKSSSIIIKTLTSVSSLGGKKTEKEVDVLKVFNIHENRLIATNNMYSPSFSLKCCGLPTNQFPAGCNDNVCQQKINRRFVRSLTNVTGVIIKITSTASKTVPCLSHLRIYGKPTGMSYNDLMKFYREYFPENVLKTDSPSTSSSSGLQDNSESEETKSIRAKRSVKDLESIAPLEFLDSLTNEVMDDPYSLPSGRCIDKTSLTKYMSSFNDPKDACDPFTRIVFDQTAYPKPNDELRKRIKTFHETNGQSEIELENKRRRRLLENTMEF